MTPEEEALYFAAATSEKMQQHSDATLLHDVATVLLDCGLRPEDCSRLRPETLRNGMLKIHFGKTDSARRRIPMREQTETDDAVFAGFELYTLRHTCLTRWAPHMDPWTLAYLAGHRDMAITKRYVHPQEDTVRQAMGRAWGGHNSRHMEQESKLRRIRDLAQTA